MGVGVNGRTGGWAGGWVRVNSWPLAGGWQVYSVIGTGLTRPVADTEVRPTRWQLQLQQQLPLKLQLQPQLYAAAATVSAAASNTSNE